MRLDQQQRKGPTLFTLNPYTEKHTGSLPVPWKVGHTAPNPPYLRPFNCIMDAKSQIPQEIWDQSKKDKVFLRCGKKDHKAINFNCREPVVFDVQVKSTKRKREYHQKEATECTSKNVKVNMTTTN